MRALLNLVPLAGCGLMMAACMGLMSRGRAKQAPVTPDVGDQTEVAALRAEVEALRAELRAQRDRG